MNKLESIGRISSFTFRVLDDGGTANGGIDIDPTANTALAFDVSAAISTVYISINGYQSKV